MPETSTCASPQPEYLESDNSWVRVGTIMNVFIQPLFSGNAVVTKDYMCKNVGLIAIQNNCEIRKKLVSDINRLNSRNFLAYGSGKFCVHAM